MRSPTSSQADHADPQITLEATIRRDSSCSRLRVACNNQRGAGHRRGMAQELSSIHGKTPVQVHGKRHRPRVLDLMCEFTGGLPRIASAGARRESHASSKQLVTWDSHSFIRMRQMQN